ncbi:hypothetical protein PI126_g7925 [Phytophthora idaei]|nr:hypothetical protein PI126_g7925 [Phytophthora idaei]
MRTLAAVVTLQTNSGGTVTLETTVIRGSTGSAGFEILVDEGPQDTLRADGRGAASGGDAEQVPVASSSAATRNQHGDPTIPLVSPEGSVSGSGNTFVPGGAGGAGAGRAPPPRRTYVRETTGYSASEARPPQQPIVVHEKAKAVKLTKFKGLDHTMSVTTWLKTVRAEVRRQAVSMRVQRRDDQLYHESGGRVLEWLSAHNYPETTYVQFEKMRRKATKDGVRMLTKGQADATGYTPLTARVVTAKKMGRREHVKRYEYQSCSGYQGCCRGQRATSSSRASARSPSTDRVVIADSAVEDERKGITGAVDRVLGVRRFRFKTPYGRDMTVAALVVEGSPGEFLLGEHWMMRNGVEIDFTACGMKWYDGDNKKIVLFSCTTNRQLDDDGTVQVRLVKAAKVVTSTGSRLELAVPTPEGTTGLCMPAHRVEPHLLLAPTLITVWDGKVSAPVMNLVGQTTKLASKKPWGLGTDDRRHAGARHVRGADECDGAAVVGRPEREGRTTKQQEELDMGDMNDDDKELLLMLLWRYPKPLEPREDRIKARASSLWVQRLRIQEGKDEGVIPPLRSQDIGNPGDRWALDVAGPLPTTTDGNRYVVAAVDYATRCAVAAVVPCHTAVDTAKFIVEKLILVYGPMPRS